MELSVLRGDITALDVDAIVNAANSRLMPGGGVCGAIFHGAGPKLIDACQQIGHCATGEAVITPGFNLPANYILHTVGPVWRGGGENEEELLASCYRSCLDLAAENDITSIAFPAISTGIFGFPSARAAEIAVATVRDWAITHPAGPQQVIFCCFDTGTEELYRDQLAGS
ncbi:O-acetyl-ADP-ribose deacetylase [Emcibacter nanhaiensis]|uniref:O-acetyl-ADP-ribose deacetylase n=1 Tax=Emcibacter nanhaiensis TaxID=1505037 RepID=A0A501PGW7_9PROT|nr:O-acetyl-ADP-ribose deacetylase [Emcibacter nanhaiensis]TPD59445.1 O-acetyl-ADP-ribose deacetylase [Emcibacter nanhaiensis]